MELHEAVREKLMGECGDDGGDSHGGDEGNKGEFDFCRDFDDSEEMVGAAFRMVD